MEYPTSADQISWRRLRDEAVAADLRDRLTHDERTTHLALRVSVGDGVAVVEGEVGSEEERRLVGTLLRHQAGLFAVWDLLELPGRPLDLLDLGCGGKKQFSRAIGVDRVPHPGVDVVADLEDRLPFEADSLDHAFAVHVLEHISSLVGLMNELHRLIRATGTLHVLTPNWRFVNAVADPTHVRLMDVQTFKHFGQPRPGVALWRPLMVTASESTVYADLQPIKDSPPASAGELARWFT